MLKSPHMAQAVSLAALFAVRACFSLRADGTLKQTRPIQAICSDAITAKEKEAKFSKKLRLIRNDMPSRRVCGITLLEVFLRNLPVFRSAVMCFVLSGKVFLFF